MSEQQPPTQRPRLSLTKGQLGDPVALDLLQLLQGMTSDGRLSDDEIRGLSSWLQEHSTVDLPAVEHLCTTLREILADGKVTTEERKWLHKEIEAVLPKQERGMAATRRREAAAESRAETARLKQEERESRAPIADFDFMIAGVFYEGRQKTIPELLT